MMRSQIILDKEAKMKKGTVLQNGAILLQAKKSIYGGEVILALFGSEFVTWLNKDTGGFVMGHYSQTLADALKDFDERR